MSNHKEHAPATEMQHAVVSRGAGMNEGSEIHGRFVVVCHGPDGKVKWEDTIENVVTTLGKNLALDTFLAGSAYTATVYMGLISSVGYTTGPVVGDIMSSHAAWTEAGLANAPTYTAPRKTTVWAAAAAGSKSLTAPLVFAFTGSGTVKGCFLVFGTGALSTIDNTAGTLYSAGLFTNSDKVVSSLDTVSASYTASM